MRRVRPTAQSARRVHGGEIAAAGVEMRHRARVKALLEHVELVCDRARLLREKIVREMGGSARRSRAAHDRRSERGR